MKKTTDDGLFSQIGYIYNITHTPKSQGTSWKRLEKDQKSQRTWKSTERQCLLQIIGKFHPQ